MIREENYCSYKPIPKYKKGDMVYRSRAGIWFNHPEPISRVFVKERDGKYWIEYYFPHERTPYAETELRETLEEQLTAEALEIIEKANAQLKHITEFAAKRNIDLVAKVAPLLQYNPESNDTDKDTIKTQDPIEG